jgi:hypothetical protein
VLFLTEEIQIGLADLGAGHGETGKNAAAPDGVQAPPPNRGIAKRRPFWCGVAV